MTSLLAMYEVVVATHVAILRAKTPEELYRAVCETIAESGQFLLCAIVSPNPVTSRISVDAAAGSASGTLRQALILTDASLVEERGILGEAFRTCEVSVSNDFLADSRLASSHTDAKKVGVAAGAAIPLSADGYPVGVILLYARAKHVFDDRVIGLLRHTRRSTCLPRHRHPSRATLRFAYLSQHVWQIGRAHV